MTKMSASRRRKDRANVTGRLQGVFVKCDRLIPRRELRVFNISELGIGADAALVPDPPGQDQVLDAKLLVGTTVAPVRLRVVHVRQGVIGMEFVMPSALLCGAIRSYFEPELAGASLRPLDGGGKRRSYKSNDGNCLEIQTGSPGVVEKFSVQVLGNLVSWDARHGLKLIQNERRETVPEFLLKQLIKLAKSADVVEPELRNQIEAVLAGTYGIGPE